VAVDSHSSSSFAAAPGRPGAWRRAPDAYVVGRVLGQLVVQLLGLGGQLRELTFDPGQILARCTYVDRPLRFRLHRRRRPQPRPRLRHGHRGASGQVLLDPPGRSRIAPSPNRPTTRSHTRSRSTVVRDDHERAWPAVEEASSAPRVSTSRSLVGSSSSSTLGPSMRSRSSCSRRRSPPDSSPTRVNSRSPLKPNRSSAAGP